VPLDLASPLRELRGIGPSRERRLAAEGVGDVRSLLLHLPSRYEDRRRVSRVAQVREEGAYTLEGRLVGVRLVLRRGRRFSLVRGRLEDGSGALEVVWFNRPYLPRQVDPDAVYSLHGRVKRRPEGLQLQNPSVEAVARRVHAGRIVPVYPPLGPLGPAMVRRLLDEAAGALEAAASVEEPLPEDLLARRSLAPLGPALVTLHRPPEGSDVEALNRRATAAHRRLIYGELLDFQLRVAAARRRARARTKGHRIRWTPAVERIVARMLPFELTGAQRRVLAEIVDDLTGDRPMRRLVQGDVGSGKTAVAAAAFVSVLESGLQAAFMAPTELLAEQHYATLEALLGSRYRLALVTGSTMTEDLRRRLGGGEIDLAIGTHALIQERLELARLGLAIVDEQHRFGVAQRTALGEKGDRTDLLVMTATPIPRTLTLTAYGDLDLSVIDELPPGRRSVATEVVAAGERARIEERLAVEIEGGGQAYVVFPTIHRRDDAGSRSLEEGAAVIARRLPGVAAGVVHGQLPIEDRTRVMRAFAAGELRLLLATTVIEVGVDVPAATLMVIESAERFGLAQLHQLRGRVGRGARAASCVALHGALTDDAERRLAVFARTTDGFEIAEEDLAIRGPGELLGTRQAGVPRFRVADLRADAALLEMARSDAREIARERPELLERLIGGSAGRGERLTRA
jgi:ATP-dependent DNA helicase RecG